MPRANAQRDLPLNNFTSPVFWSLDPTHKCKSGSHLLCSHLETSCVIDSRPDTSSLFFLHVTPPFLSSLLVYDAQCMTHTRFQRNEGLDLQRFDVGMVSEIRGEEECAAHCFCREFVLHRVRHVSWLLLPAAAHIKTIAVHCFCREFLLRKVLSYK